MDFSYNKVMVWLEDASSVVLANSKRIVIAVGGVIVLVFAFLGYGYYKEWAQAAAHKDFIEALRYYDAPVTGIAHKPSAENGIEFISDQEKWKKVEEVFRTGASKHHSAGLGSLFLAYQADALAHQAKLDEAIEMLSTAIRSMPESMRDFYTLKVALMKLDSSKQAVAQDGLSLLKKIAEDSQHLAHEAALYYIGYFFWVQKDFAQARNYWQQLMVKYSGKDTKNQSGFSDLVKEKLKLISAEW